MKLKNTLLEIWNSPAMVLRALAPLIVNMPFLMTGDVGWLIFGTTSMGVILGHHNERRAGNKRAREYEIALAVAKRVARDGRGDPASALRSIEENLGRIFRRVPPYLSPETYERWFDEAEAEATANEAD